MVVGIRELKAHLSEYVEAVEAGECIEITKRGRVVAVIAPPGSRAAALPEDVRQLISAGRVSSATRTGPFMPVTPIAGGRSLADVLADRDDD